MRYQLFALLRGTVFSFHEDAATPGVAVPMTLVEARESPAPPQFEQFSLHWDGPPAPHLRQGTYRVTHPQLGEAAIFIVPIGHHPDGVRYEAVFSVRRDDGCA